LPLWFGSIVLHRPTESGAPFEYPSTPCEPTSSRNTAKHSSSIENPSSILRSDFPTPLYSVVDIPVDHKLSTTNQFRPCRFGQENQCMLLTDIANTVLDWGGAIKRLPGSNDTLFISFICFATWPVGPGQ